MHAAALAEDPSAFDYDSVYDSIQEQRVQPKLAEKHARKSRYIEGLLDKAKEREREQDIVYERKCAHLAARSTPFVLFLCELTEAHCQSARHGANLKDACQKLALVVPVEDETLVTLWVNKFSICRLLRERKVEDHLFGDKEKFVTAAYRKKLEEDKKWLEEERRREEAEVADDVRKKGHLGDFYRRGQL